MCAEAQGHVILNTLLDYINPGMIVYLCSPQSKGKYSWHDLKLHIALFFFFFISVYNSVTQKYHHKRKQGDGTESQKKIR